MFYFAFNVICPLHYSFIWKRKMVLYMSNFVHGIRQLMHFHTAILETTIPWILLKSIRFLVEERYGCFEQHKLLYFG